MSAGVVCSSGVVEETIPKFAWHDKAVFAHTSQCVCIDVIGDFLESFAAMVEQSS